MAGARILSIELKAPLQILKNDICVFYAICLVNS